TWFSFFFSSRRRHTRFSRDWSSDVCSSDLHQLLHHAAQAPRAEALPDGQGDHAAKGALGHVEIDAVEGEELAVLAEDGVGRAGRSEERRVGTECTWGGAPGHRHKEDYA